MEDGAAQAVNEVRNGMTARVWFLEEACAREWFETGRRQVQNDTGRVIQKKRVNF